MPLSLTRAYIVLELSSWCFSIGQHFTHNKLVFLSWCLPRYFFLIKCFHGIYGLDSCSTTTFICVFPLLGVPFLGSFWQAETAFFLENRVKILLLILVLYQLIAYSGRLTRCRKFEGLQLALVFFVDSVVSNSHSFRHLVGLLLCFWLYFISHSFLSFLQLILL